MSTTPAEAGPPHGSPEPAPTAAPGDVDPAVPGFRPEVVVGILDDPGAVPLVHAALAQATARRASVRVVRVLPVGSGQREVLAADSLAYAVTRAAGENGPALASRFEVAVGDPVEVLLERARGAALLVLGADRDASTVAARCLSEATCAVLVVEDGDAVGDSHD
ncbi:MAG: universal stress protein [Actinomycetota bacterium]|nr:universal stress protein [Actinomycetota bacterium]